jgi:single-stranded-DNA-specific exonuclease
MKADLVVTVADLGSALFQALKWLEPCGMGNPPPRLLIRNCWFTSTEQNWTPDKHFPKIRYPKTEFQLWDESVTARGFSGIWWGHTPQDIPKERCDAILELYPDLRNSVYQVRLIAVRPTVNLVKSPFTSDWLVDLRGEAGYRSTDNHPSNGREEDQSIYVNQCPTSWSELNDLFRQAVDAQKRVLLAYHLPRPSPPIEIWRQLVGIAKYLDRTGERTTVETLQSYLSLSKPTVKAGLDALTAFGFKMEITPQGQIQILGYDVMTQVQKAEWSVITQRLTDIIQEEQFRRQYFSQVPLATIQSMGFG